MDCLLVDGLNVEMLLFKVEYLTQIHDNAFVDLLPKMSSEDLDQRDLKSWNLPMHKYTS